MSVYLTTLVVEQRVGGIELLDLPCLALGGNLNISYNYMADLWRQVITVYDYNKPPPNKIPGELPQPEYGYSQISEGIIFLRRSKHLHNTYADFKNYYCEEVMKMTKLEILLLFSLLAI